MKTGEHTFREDVYIQALKYQRWNNELKPFRLLKRRVTNIFQKRNSLSDDSRGISTQTIMNHMESEEERSIVNSDKRDNIHSDWSDLIPVNEGEYGKVYKNRKGTNAVGVAITLANSTAEATMMPSVPPTKRQLRTLY